MSTGAIRSHPRRSTARSAASSPYARPKQPAPKKSPWALVTGLFHLVNPLRPRTTSPIEVDDDEQDDDDDDDVSDDSNSPPQSLSARGRQMAHTTVAPPQPQPQMHIPMDTTPSMLLDSSSPEKNINNVITFLRGHQGQAISPLEAEGLISLLHKSTPVEKREPFRFSTSSLPSTPARGNSPAGPNNDIFSFGATPASNPSRKTLSKNPNGAYRWSGGGSARPSKNRYASPAFGTPSRATSEHIIFQDSPPTPSESGSAKRRRMEQTTPPPASTPPPVPRSAAPGPSPTRVAASHYFPSPLSTPTSSPSAQNPNASAATPARTALSLVKSTPAHPSPLRQAWSGSPASSVSSNGSSGSQQGTPTKAATLLTALIRDADAEVPKRTAEVRNPYQSASPVGVRVTNTHPATERGKRARATGRLGASAREAEKEKAREKEEKEKREVVPPQVIIEATMPKGSKRSRPPAHFNASASLNSLAAPASTPSPRRSPRLEPQHVVDDDAQEKDMEEREAGAPAAKRAKPNASSAVVNGSEVMKAKVVEPAPAPVPVFPVSVSAPSVFGAGTSKSSSTSNGAPPFTLGSSVSASGGFEFRMGVGHKPLASAPKEPSKLRYSFAPSTPPPVADKETKVKQLFPMAPPPVPSSATNSKAKFSFSPTPASTSTPRQDPKEQARMLPPSALPSFVFTVLTNHAGLGDSNVNKAAREAARRLEKGKLPVFDFAASPVQDKGKEKAPAAAAGGFNWGAPPKPAGSWMCGTCMLMNGPEVKDKCTVCDAPAPVSAAAPKVQGFNWAAAGTKPPTAAGKAEGAWTCGTCMLQNGPEVKEKCSVCDAPR